MGEKGLSSANEPAPAAVPKATAETGTAMTESVSGRFEEAARRAQERIGQRTQAKTKRATSGDDVTKT
jgi:hypothetical protein